MIATVVDLPSAGVGDLADSFDLVVAVSAGDASPFGDRGDVVGEVVLVFDGAAICADLFGFSSDQVVLVLCLYAIGGGDPDDAVEQVVLVSGDAVDAAGLLADPVVRVVFGAAAVAVGVDLAYDVAVVVEYGLDQALLLVVVRRGCFGSSVA